MKKAFVGLLVIISTILSPVYITAQIRDSIAVRIYFEQGSSTVDPTFRDNLEALDKVAQLVSVGDVQCIDIEAWASPEGSDTSNERLSAKRASALATWFENNLGVSADLITTRAGGVGWTMLRDLVAASDASYRDEVVDIIDNMPLYVRDVRNRIIGSRRKTLMSLHNGSVWKDLNLSFFPDVRTCLGVTIVLRNTVVALSDVSTEIPYISTSITVPVIPSSVSRHHSADRTVSVPLLAVKSNMLYDVALAPNVEVEYPFSSDYRYSIMAEYWAPWYVWHHNSRAYELLYWGLEGRRWLGNRAGSEALTGHFVGIYAGGGYYDFEWSSKGYQGEFGGAGITYGYSKRLSHSFRLEFTISAGFVHTGYSRYVGKLDDRYLVWQHDGNRNYFGPTKANVSLVWLLYRNKTYKMEGGDI